VVWALRIAVWLLPILVFFITRRICLELQRSDWRAVLFGRDIGVVEEMPDGSYRAPLEQLDAGERYTVTSRDDGPANPPTPNDLKPRHWVLWTVRRSLVVWDRNHRVRKPTAMEYDVAHRGLWGYRRRRRPDPRRRRARR
jgi:ubiquinol-cytochrome c reductase cytochrome b subunit